MTDQNKLDELVRDLTKVNSVNGGFLTKAETRKRLEAFQHDAFQRGARAAAEAVFNLEETHFCDKSCCREYPTRVLLNKYAAVEAARSILDKGEGNG